MATKIVKPNREKWLKDLISHFKLNEKKIEGISISFVNKDGSPFDPFPNSHFFGRTEDVMQGIREPYGTKIEFLLKNPLKFKFKQRKK